jgi:pyruvate carboxylase
MVALRRVARIIVGMTVKEILAQLKSLGDDARRKHNTKAGAPDNQFGVKLGDKVSEGDTLLIVEAMKTMNQIPAPRSGGAPVRRAHAVRWRHRRSSRHQRRASGRTGRSRHRE